MKTETETRATLVEALKAMVEFAFDTSKAPPISQARAAIAQAEAEQNDSRATPTKQLLLTEVIERYPRMLQLLRMAELLLFCNCGHVSPCTKCQIQALLIEVEK